MKEEKKKPCYIPRTKKIQILIDQQRINLAEVDYLDLDSAANVVQYSVTVKGNEEKVSKDNPLSLSQVRMTSR